MIAIRSPMYLRRNSRKKNGTLHRCFSVAEKQGFSILPLFIGVEVGIGIDSSIHSSRRKRTRYRFGWRLRRRSIQTIFRELENTGRRSGIWHGVGYRSNRSYVTYAFLATRALVLGPPRKISPNAISGRYSIASTAPLKTSPRPAERPILYGNRASDHACLEGELRQLAQICRRVHKKKIGRAGRISKPRACSASS